MFSYLKGFLNPTNPSASLRHAAFALVIVSGCAWLTIALFRPAGLDANWVASFALLLAAVTTSKIMGQPDSLAGLPAASGQVLSTSGNCVDAGSAKANAVFASDPNRGQV